MMRGASVMILGLVIGYVLGGWEQRKLAELRYAAERAAWSAQLRARETESFEYGYWRGRTEELHRIHSAQPDTAQGDSLFINPRFGQFAERWGDLMNGWGR